MQIRPLLQPIHRRKVYARLVDILEEVRAHEERDETLVDLAQDEAGFILVDGEMVRIIGGGGEVLFVDVVGCVHVARGRRGDVGRLTDSLLVHLDVF
jgi:hypothetical protein